LPDVRISAGVIVLTAVTGEQYWGWHSHKSVAGSCRSLGDGPSLDVTCFICRYAKMSGDEIRLDRYAKFRKLGQWEEFLVQGGQWREAREARAKVCT